MFRRTIAMSLCFFLLPLAPIHAQEMVLPKPGVMVLLSPAFTPTTIKGMVLDPKNPFKIDFIINRGQAALTPFEKQEEYARLIKYFMASLAVPDDQQWVNLSPYEHERVITDTFGQTQMGNDLLIQDYLLKQLSASLLYPEAETGKEFWKRVYEQSALKYPGITAGGKTFDAAGKHNGIISTFNKVWIVPDKAVIYENGNTVYVMENHLKVMTEEDYLAAQKQSLAAKPSPVTEIIRNVVVPVLEKEVNEGRNFAILRQVYNSMLLAAWYKRTLQNSLMAKLYADKSKINGVKTDPKQNQIVYEQYLQAFKKGVFNLIKEETSVSGKIIPRRYFSGGTKGYSDYAQIVTTKQELDPEEKALVNRAVGEGDVASVQTVNAADGQSEHDDEAAKAKKAARVKRVIAIAKNYPRKAYPGGWKLHALLNGVFRNYPVAARSYDTFFASPSNQDKVSGGGRSSAGSSVQIDRDVIVNFGKDLRGVKAAEVLKVIDLLKFELKSSNITRTTIEGSQVSDEDEVIARAIAGAQKVVFTAERSAGHKTFDVSFDEKDRDRITRWLKGLELQIYQQIFFSEIMDNTRRPISTKDDQGHEWTMLIDHIPYDDPWQPLLEKFIFEHMIPKLEDINGTKREELEKNFRFHDGRLETRENVTDIMHILTGVADAFRASNITIEKVGHQIKESLEFTADELNALGINIGDRGEAQRQIVRLIGEFRKAPGVALIKGAATGVVLNSRFVVFNRKGWVAKDYYERFNHGLNWFDFRAKMISSTLAISQNGNSLELAPRGITEDRFKRVFGEAFYKPYWDMMLPYFYDEHDFEIAEKINHLIAAKLGLRDEVTEEEYGIPYYVKYKRLYWISVPSTVDPQDFQRRMMNVLVNLNVAIDRISKSKPQLRGDQTLTVMADLNPRGAVPVGIARKILSGMLKEEEDTEVPMFFKRLPKGMRLAKYLARDVLFRSQDPEYIPALIKDLVVANAQEIFAAYDPGDLPSFMRYFVSVLKNAYSNGVIQDPLKKPGVKDALVEKSNLLIDKAMVGQELPLETSTEKAWVQNHPEAAVLASFLWMNEKNAADFILAWKGKENGEKERYLLKVLNVVDLYVELLTGEKIYGRSAPGARGGWSRKVAQAWAANQEIRSKIQDYLALISEFEKDMPLRQLQIRVLAQGLIKDHKTMIAFMRQREYVELFRELAVSMETAGDAAMNSTVPLERRRWIVDQIDDQIFNRKNITIWDEKREALVLKIEDPQSQPKLYQDLSLLLNGFRKPYTITIAADKKSVDIVINHIYFKKFLDWLDGQSALLKEQNLAKVQDDRRLAMYDLMKQETQGPEEDFYEVGRTLKALRFFVLGKVNGLTPTETAMLINYGIVDPKTGQPYAVVRDKIIKEAKDDEEAYRSYFANSNRGSGNEDRAMSVSDKEQYREQFTKYAPDIINFAQWILDQPKYQGKKVVVLGRSADPIYDALVSITQTKDRYKVRATDVYLLDFSSTLINKLVYEEGAFEAYGDFFRKELAAIGVNEYFDNVVFINEIGHERSMTLRLLSLFTGGDVDLVAGFQYTNVDEKKGFRYDGSKEGHEWADWLDTQFKSGRRYSIEFINDRISHVYYQSDAEQRRLNRSVIVSVVNQAAENAQLSNKGGIDMNASSLDLVIKRDGNGVVLPLEQQDLDQIRIDGLVPVIINIFPAKLYFASPNNPLL